MRPGETTLRHLLDTTGLSPALAHAATTEVVVNEPGRFGVEQDGRWTWHDAPALDFDALEAIAILSAHMGGKDVGGRIHACASALPDGQRIKMVLPPAVASGTVSLTIRRRALSFVPTLEWLAERDYFEMLNPAVNWCDYFAHDVLRGRPRGSDAIPVRKTVVICGEIGSSKTTMGEALLRALDPTLRLLTVEGSAEWRDLPSDNWKPLYYDDADPVGATLRVQDAMQMAPVVLAFGELRGSGGDAWAFTRALRTGTPGITTVHAPNARRAFHSIEAMIKQSPEGRGYEPAEIHAQLRQSIGVICHAVRFLPSGPDERTRYRLTEVLEVGETAAEDRMVSAC